MENIKRILKPCSSEESTVEEGSLGLDERKKYVLEISRKATNVWTLPSVRKTFISVNKRWF